MHHALEIPEILALICQNLMKTRDPNRDERNNLLNFAQSCSTITDAALDKLWHFSSLERLMRTWPSSLYNIEAQNLADKCWRGQMVLTRDIMPSDMSRLSMYAARVVVLLSYSHRQIRKGVLYWDRSISDQLARAHPALLTPILKHLEIFQCTDYSFMSAFISSNLQTIQVLNHNLGPALTTGAFNLLNLARTRCPKLRHVCLYSKTMTRFLFDLPETSRSTQDSQVALVQPTENLAPLVRLLGMTSLTVLKLHIHWYWQATLQEVNGSMFPNLQHLECMTEHPNLATALITKLDSPKMEHFTCGITQPGFDSSTIANLATAFADHCEISGLRSFQLIWAHCTLDLAGVEQLASKLRKAKSLQTLSISSSGAPLHVDANLLDDLAAHFPALERLKLGGHPLLESPTPPIATLVDAINFVGKMDKLKSLGLCFDATKRSLAHVDGLQPVKLENLDPSASLADDAESVAKFLRKFCPRVKITMTRGIKPGWHEVEKRLASADSTGVESQSA